MIKMKRKLKGAEIFYRIVGEGTPVVMLHGWGVDHRILSGCMEPVFAEGLQQGFQRIYLDLPGMGQSTENGHIRNSDDVLDVLLQFIDTIIPDKRFILVGESYGGYLARGLVNKRAEQILGLLMVCPLIFPGYRKGCVPELTVLESDDTLLFELGEQERSSFAYITVIRTRTVWERFKTDIYDALQHQNTKFLNEVLDGSFSYDVDSFTQIFDKPCLIIAGRQDCEVGYQDQFRLLERYTAATYMVFDRAGHNLQIEQPEQFTSAVRAWFKQYFS